MPSKYVSKEAICEESALKEALYGYQKTSKGKIYTKIEKDRIRARVRKAIRAGKIKKVPCERCGSPHSEAAHKDYSRPFDVIFLCKSCHCEYDGWHRHKTLTRKR